jgi:hypothetical protein
MLEGSSHDLGQADLVLGSDPLGLAVKLIWQLNLGPNHDV